MSVELFRAMYGVVFLIVVACIISYSFIGVNYAYEIAEASAVGLTVGMTLYTSLVLIYNTGWLKLVGGNYLVLIFMAIAALGALRIFPRYLVLARPATALQWGVNAAIIIIGEPYNFLRTWSSYAMQSLSNPATWVLYLALITCFSYFIWSKKLSMHDRPTTGIIPRIGRLFMFYLAGETMTALIFKRVEFLVSLVSEIRPILISWGLPV